jgi:hypothetical protein
LCLATWVNNIQDGIAHPPGSDEKHSIKLELNQLSKPPEGKFWTYTDKAGHEWKEENGAWWVWYNGGWAKSGNATLESIGVEPDCDVATRFSQKYFALHPEEKPPKAPNGWISERDVEFIAVVFALHPKAIDDPKMDEWTTLEIERIKAYATSRGMTLRQVVWENNL